MPTANLSTLNIKAATYGSSDVRGTVEHAFDGFLNSNPTATAWSFPVNNSFFGNDPNPNFLKACVVIYQYRLTTPDGRTAFSTLYVYSGSPLFQSRWHYCGKNQDGEQTIHSSLRLSFRSTTDSVSSKPNSYRTRRRRLDHHRPRRQRLLNPFTTSTQRRCRSHLRCLLVDRRRYGPCPNFL